MEDDKPKLDTIRDDDHLERVVFYLNDLAIQFRDKGFRMPQYTESQNKRVLQDLELLLLTLMQFHTKMLPIKYPKKLQYRVCQINCVNGHSVKLKCFAQPSIYGGNYGNTTRDIGRDIGRVIKGL